MIATHILWRWLRDHKIETTQPGERCDWITPDHVYVTLGWAKPVEGVTTD